MSEKSNWAIYYSLFKLGWYIRWSFNNIGRFQTKKLQTSHLDSDQPSIKMNPSCSWIAIVKPNLISPFWIKLYKPNQLQPIKYIYIFEIETRKSQSATQSLGGIGPHIYDRCKGYWSGAKDWQSLEATTTSEQPLLSFY